MNPEITYFQILEDLKNKIIQTRQRMVHSVNVQMLIMYWDIGNTIDGMEQEQKWGAKIVQKLSRDLYTSFPDMKGISLRNLRYMRDFSLAYPDFKDGFSMLQQAAATFQDANNQSDTILQQPAAKLPGTTYVLHPAANIPWTHNQVVLDKVKTTEERIFYLVKCAQNGWSRNVLAVQIETKLHLRQGKALTNFDNTLPSPLSDLARETLKNPYLLDFLDLQEDIQERDLEQGLLKHLKKFLLELGRGFAYVGNQFNIKVEDDDFFLDLLFYNYHLHCFVIFELKIGDFKPEYAGKLNFYINTINNQVKGEADHATIGVLLCKTPNETVVKYSLQNILAPLGVAEYKLSTHLPKTLKNEIPSVKELEQALQEDNRK